MQTPQLITITPDDVDADGIAETQSPSDGVALSLDGAVQTAGLDLARKIEISSASNISAIDFTIVGLDADGNAATEVLTGPNATTVTSTLYYSVITSITPDGTSGSSLTVGTSDEIAYRSICLDYLSDEAALVDVDVTGTANYTVQECFQRINQGETANYKNTTSLSSKTTDTHAFITKYSTAVRFITSSYTNGASFKIGVFQSGRL
jgi:hypothetical protein